MSIKILLAAGTAATFATAALAIDEDRAAGGSPVPHAGQVGERAQDSLERGARSPAGAAAGGTAAGDPAVAGHHLDTDRDGFISRAEAKGSSALSNRFDQLDGDRDGKLSPFEFGGAGTDSPGGASQ